MVVRHTDFEMVLHGYAGWDCDAGGRLQGSRFFKTRPGVMLTAVSGAMPMILFLGFIVLIVVGAIFGGISARKRKQAIRQWAASLGFSFSEGRNGAFDVLYPEFACFQQGKNQYAFNIAEGEFEGRQVCAFDYHYETTSTTTTTDSKGRTSTRTQTNHHYFSAVMVEPTLLLKALFIRPEGFFDKVSRFFGKDDLNFESAAFSRRYHVTAPDRRWAYDVLHGRAVEFLLEQPAYTIQFAPRRVLIMRGQSRLDAESFHAALRTVDTLLDMLPGYVKEQQLLEQTQSEGA